MRPGDIQVGMMDKKGQLEVEIIRARGLVVKPGSKTLPGKSRGDASVTARHPHCFLLTNTCQLSVVVCVCVLSEHR